MPESNEEGLPVFPDITPNSITVSTIYNFYLNDIQTEEDLQELIALMFYWPEREFYFYHERYRPNALINGCAAILKDEIELHYYKHPKHERDYVRIKSEGESYAWDWQREVVEKGPMYLRVRLKLAEWVKRNLEIKQKIAAEKEASNNPLELKPNIIGFGLDLPKAVNWLKKLWRRRRG